MSDLPGYRRLVTGGDLVPFEVKVKETDLYIRASSNVRGKAERLVRKYRSQIESYISRHPDFRTSLTPLQVTGDSPAIIKAMLEAGGRAGVGPMASVAGAIAEFVGTELLKYCDDLIIENGGDIFLRTTAARVVGIFAGASPLTGQIGLEIAPEDTPIGICTSSGTVGHSLSLGKADAVVVLSSSASFADAMATATGNLVRLPEDIPDALAFAVGIKATVGVVIVKGDKIGSAGKVKLCRTSWNSRTA